MWNNFDSFVQGKGCDRRIFLQGSATVLISSLLSSCSNGNVDLKLAILQGSLPLQMLNEIQQKIDDLGIIKIESKATPAILYELLKNQLTPENDQEKAKIQLSQFNNKQKNKFDLITLSNYWLNPAIKENLIDNLALGNLSNWQNITPLFKQLVTRNNQGQLDSQGKTWAAPYRWGFTMIAYRKDKFEQLGWQPKDWGDLWKEEIKHRFSLLNQSREVIGLVLKKLGYSYNTENLENIANLKPELEKLHQQVKFYDSQNYLQPLILGDTWLAQGWSTDIMPVVERYSNIGGIIPFSGTSLWADLWVKPKHLNSEEILTEKIDNWINFCWQEKSARQISLFSHGLSPINLDIKSPSTLGINMGAIAQKGEFIEPLSDDSLRQYQNVWKSLF